MQDASQDVFKVPFSPQVVSKNFFFSFGGEYKKDVQECCSKGNWNQTEILAVLRHLKPKVLFIFELS